MQHHPGDHYGDPAKAIAEVAVSVVESIITANETEQNIFIHALGALWEIKIKKVQAEETIMLT